MVRLDVSSDPFQRFGKVFAKAQQAQPKDPNAMLLSTVGADGRPSSRVVLMKGFDARGFVFYTNTLSRKGRELSIHPFAALCFYWPSLDFQVRIEGNVEPVTPQEADAYFTSRARGSQLGAWASHQSEVLETREELEERLAQLEAKYQNAPVPRPPHWSGYRLSPYRMEFWEGMPNRLHHRTLYRLDKGQWHQELLNP
jgi:pyridoxamine 5'-phosphate oxidase